jgi:class 3 adenylate cyclase
MTQSAIGAGATLPGRLEAVRDASGFDPAIIAAFDQFIRTAPDEDLFRANPYRYAAKTGITEQQATDLFLYATHAGILEFNWGVLCPNCYAFVTSAGGLRAIKTQSHCDICNVDFEVVVDDNVEVAFMVAPTVRHIRFHDLNTVDLQRDWISIFYSPSRFVDPMIREQLQVLMMASCLLQNEQHTHLDLKGLKSGARYLALTPRQHAVGNLYAVEGDSTTQVDFDIFDGRFVPDNVALAPGDVRLNFHNRTGSAITIGVILDPKTFQPDMNPEDSERIIRFFTTPPKFLTGKQVATSQVFRELFRAESIPSDLGVAFKSVTFLFSDLKGSTALYNRVGDIRAYQIVREHFALLRDVIAEFGGAIVKTMGDAVMASFAEPLAALEAAIVISREIPRIGSEDESLILRIGIHSGPCIAVESNDRLDYFGQTVNIAARVENVAGAGEIVITEPVYNAPGALDVLKAIEIKVQEDKAVLRGLDEEVTFYRLG